MKIAQRVRVAVIIAIMSGSVFAASPQAPRLVPNVSNLPSIFDGIVNNPADSPEISTAEFQKALDDGSAIVLDARPYDEYTMSHIPGALTVPGNRVQLLRYTPPI